MITLTSIRCIAALSEETHCYSANLVFEGKTIGVVSNEGHGGCDSFHGDQEAYARADAWCKANLPSWDCNGTQTPTDIEMHCCDLVNIHLSTKELKRAMKGKVLAQVGGELMTFSWKGVKDITSGHIAAVVKKHPQARVLNSMDFAEALAIFREAA